MDNSDFSLELDIEDDFIFDHFNQDYHDNNSIHDEQTSQNNKDSDMLSQDFTKLSSLNSMLKNNGSGCQFVGKSISKKHDVFF